VTPETIGPTNPVIGLIVFLRAVRIRYFVFGVVLVDEILHYRAALKQPDGRPVGVLVRQGWDLQCIT
jgi:hypothetical protein